MAETDDRVRAAEADIDRFFEDQLAIRGSIGPLVDCPMERAELLVTGARGVTSRDRGALTGLCLNVIGGLNWSIREANRLAAGSRDRIPEDLDSIATEAISLGIFYQYVQDAFMSYWKGYARVEFPSDHVVHFKPIPAADDLAPSGARGCCNPRSSRRGARGRTRHAAAPRRPRFKRTTVLGAIVEGWRVRSHAWRSHDDLANGGPLGRLRCYHDGRPRNGSRDSAPSGRVTMLGYGYGNPIVFACWISSE
jgi:hypothetical protein